MTLEYSTHLKLLYIGLDLIDSLEMITKYIIILLFLNEECTLNNSLLLIYIRSTLNFYDPCS